MNGSYPKTPKSTSARRWTGFVLALTVTFTISDAQQFGFSPCGKSHLALNVPSFQTKRTEQKTPLALNPASIFNETLAMRGPLSGSSRHLETLKNFQYNLVPLLCWSGSLCLPLHSCESPRAPPPMDPPYFC